MLFRSARDLLGVDIFARSTDQEELLAGRQDEVLKLGLFELIDAFQQILNKISPDDKVRIAADSISVKNRISQLVDIFESKESVTFEELFPAGVVKSEVIVTFLAILEMVRLSLVRIVQHVQTGVIRLFYI